MFSARRKIKLSDPVRLSGDGKTLPTQPFVAVALSGGVDSAVAAALLREQGYSLIGLTIWLPTPAEFAHGVLQPADVPPPAIAAAQRVAERLNIPHQVVDLRQAFYDEIIRPFCAIYASGQTPNPCVWCNARIKFGLLWEAARALGAERLATGHYAGVGYDDARSRYAIRAASENPKEQSYFLYRLSQAQLAHTLFPLAHLTKDRVREYAHQFVLEEVLISSESHGACFLADQRYHELVEDALPEQLRQPGPIVNLAGDVIGEHQGLHRYTIGQRKGLGFDPTLQRYVVALRPEINAVVIGAEQDLYCEQFEVAEVHWMGLERLNAPLPVTVKVRYRNAATPGVIIPGAQPDTVLVTVNPSKRAVTPGQSAVFYDGDVVLGGGIIHSCHAPLTPGPSLLKERGDLSSMI